MRLEISKSSTVGKLKKQFNSVFPYLKLEFFPKYNNSTLPKSIAIADDSSTLSSLSTHLQENGIMVHDLMKVSDLESKFKKHDLNVQVFRLSGKVWLETTMTDWWSLKKQNDHAKEISDSFRSTPRNVDKNDA